MNERGMMGPAQSMATSHTRSNTTKLKMILPVGKREAWRLIATPRGIASWFPLECKGTAADGKTLEFTWPGKRRELFRILFEGEKHSSFHLEWKNDARIRFYLHGRLTTLTLEVEYPKTPLGRMNQVKELVLWSFLLANLKSVALGGVDLRHRMTGRSWFKGFIDSVNLSTSAPRN